MGLEAEVEAEVDPVQRKAPTRPERPAARSPGAHNRNGPARPFVCYHSVDQPLEFQDYVNRDCGLSVLLSRLAKCCPPQSSTQGPKQQH